MSQTEHQKLNPTFILLLDLIVEIKERERERKKKDVSLVGLW